MAKNILVTGGAGFIGSHLVDALIAAGQGVVVLDNLEPQVHGDLAQHNRWPAYCNPEAEYIRGDVGDQALLERVVAGVDAVYHFASSTGVGQSMYQIAKYTAVNVQGTANLLEVLAGRSRAGNPVEKLVLSSSRAVYGEGLYRCPTCGEVCPPVRSAQALERRAWPVACPTCAGPLAPVPTPEAKPLAPGSIYAVSKQAQEQLCLCFGQAYQVPVLVLRFFNVYGPRQSISNPYTGILSTFLQRLFNGLPAELYEDGWMTRDFVYVADVVQACLLALDAPASAVLNIGSGAFTPIAEVAQALTNLVCPELTPQVVGLARVGDIRHCSADLSQARQVLGYQPVTPLQQGLEAVVAEARATASARPPADRSTSAREELLRAGLLK